MAIFDIALAFALPITDFSTVHTAAIRGRGPHRGKAAHIAAFPCDRLGQDGPNAIDREQLLVGRRVLQMLMDGLFQGFNLVAQAVKDGKAAGDRQDLGALGQ